MTKETMTKGRLRPPFSFVPGYGPVRGVFLLAYRFAT
jgi:hypothetical protein